MKIRQLFEKLQAIVKEVHEAFPNGDYSGREERMEIFKTILAPMGGKFLDKGVRCAGFEFVFPWGSVVAKLAISDEGVHTINVNPYILLRRRYIKPLLTSETVVIQPKADRSCPKLSRRSAVLSKWLCKIDGSDFDCHYGNVGVYRGKTMIFDPLEFN